MKHTRKDLDKQTVEISATLDEAEVKAAHSSALARLAPKAKAPGFRAGKVPAAVAEKYLNQSELLDTAANLAVSKALSEILAAENLQLLDQPKISVTKFVPRQILEFTATLSIVPPIKLGDVKKLKVKKDPVKVSTKDVDLVIGRLLDDAAKKTEAKRPAKKGDEVILDFVGEKDGVPFDGGKAKDYPLSLGSGNFIPGFEDGIIGHLAGDKFDLKLKFPKDYGAKSLAGQPVVFKITLKKVNEIERPPLDDKFAGGVSPEFKTVKDLKADVEKELTARASFDADEKYKSDLLNALTEKSDVEAPEILVDDQAKIIERDFTQNLSYRGQTLEQFLQSQNYKNRDDWLQKDVRPAAEKRVKQSLVLGELSRRQNIVATDQEIDAERDQILQRHTDPKLRAQFQSEEARRSLANQIITRKTLAKLAQLAS
ncbi:MAG: trigger factor [Candidatus Nomurabacteria bacterium]|jgi:trigger factor|nr:trigger factor [Candidatus Nomurabacteria bacterium]